MPEPRLVNIVFRGVSVATQARLSEVDGDAQSAFVEHETPLPVGSRIHVGGEGGEREANVAQVVEQEVGAKVLPGMKISWVQAVAKPVAAEAAPAPVAERAPSEPPEASEAGEPGETQEDPAAAATPGDTGGGKRGKQRKNRRTLK